MVFSILKEYVPSGHKKEGVSKDGQPLYFQNIVSKAHIPGILKGGKDKYLLPFNMIWDILKCKSEIIFGQKNRDCPFETTPFDYLLFV
jgi:hypothetical protein